MFGQVASTILLAVGAIVVANLLGEINYGVVTVAFIPVSIAYLFVDLGVNAALVRYIAQCRFDKNDAELRAVMRIGLTVIILVGALISAVTFALSDFFASSMFKDPSLRLLIEIGAIGLFAQSVLTACQSIFIGFERMEFHSVTVIIFSILKSLVAPVLVLLGYGTFGAVMGSTISFIATAAIGFTVVGVVFMKDRVSNGDAVSPLQELKKMLNYGYPLFVSSLLVGGLGQFLNFLTAVYVDKSAMGNYQAASNFSVLISFFAMPIGTVLFPLFSKFDSKDAQLGSVFQMSVKYASLILVPIAAALMVLSDQVVGFIYLDSYRFAALFLQLIVANSLFVGVGGISVTNILNGQGKTRINFVTNLTYLVIGLPMGVVLIPRFGVVGLLLTSFFATKPGLFYALWWIKKNFGFSLHWPSTMKIYLSVGLASLIVYLVVTLFKFGDLVTLIVGGGIMIVVYILLVTLTGAIVREDIQNLRNMIGAFGPVAPIFGLFLAIVERLIRRKGV